MFLYFSTIKNTRIDRAHSPLCIQLVTHDMWAIVSLPIQHTTRVKWMLHVMDGRCGALREKMVFDCGLP